MTMTHELRKLAEAATPGPWMRSGVRVTLANCQWHSVFRYDESSKKDENLALVGYNPKNGLGMADAAYIAAANPKTVLELLDRIAELEGALKPFADAASNFDRFPIKDATEWFAYSGQGSVDSIRHGSISVANLRRAAELVRP